MDYSKTVNLPKTDFPMRANLPNREPEILKKWEESNIYNKIQESRNDSESWILHDGPPYANGNIHIGHALNKILKDIIIKHKTMMGFKAPYVPGWDCHGLPIELKVTKELGKKAKEISKLELRKKCREYADKWINIQLEEFKRLGILGNYENPYKTMRHQYEATIVEKFGELFENDYIYKGKKPIHWCPTCETALAEAEVEYDDHTSTSIFVKFKVDPDSLNGIDGIDANNTYVVIWTTTPWTLPANLAVCLHPQFKYSAYKYGNEHYILADGLVEAFEAEAEIKNESNIKISTDQIGNFKVYHPFIDRESKVIFGRHVTLEAGTGIVHTAPGHGMEDYVAGLEHGLDILCPVDGRGLYTDEYPDMKGTHIFKANDQIIEVLKEKNSLIHSNKIEHSYPHCWRCKKPLIFRATPQWFMGMDKNNLRTSALETVDKTQWVPKWGEGRFRSMVESRPDWCLSRQRSWGVPIPSFRCKKCDENLMNTESIKFFAEIAKSEKGIDSWYSEDINDLVPDGTKCSCGSTELVKENDILDVWFDSGISSFAVLENWSELKWPANMYLEGSDQHRGWFQSSLWPAMALKGRAPFDTVLTHGFVLDDKGKAMSKSMGNVVAPEKIIKQYGADVLRLWVSSEDYRNDLKISYDLMKQISDSYRKIRNTMKFVIGNLSDFDEKENMVTYEELSDTDKWLLSKLYNLNKEIIDAYENYEFHLVYRKLQNFCAIELSSVYFDISKDILYSEASNSKKRRCNQTVLFYLYNTLQRLIAPILAFTADEIWQFNGNEGTIHQERYYKLDDKFNNSEIESKIDSIAEIKKDLLKAIELVRGEQKIRSSIETDVTLFVNDESVRTLIKNLGDESTKFFQVSKLDLVENESSDMSKHDNSSIKVTKSTGKKCVRCWNYFDKLGNNADHPELCDRCTKVILSL